MARIPYPKLEDVDERIRPFYMAGPTLNIVWMMAHAPHHADAALRLSDATLRRSEVDPVLRQVGLIRLCEAVGSPYERSLHEDIARSLGMSDELIAAAIGGSTSDRLTEMQKMVCRLAEDYAVGPRPRNEVFEYLRERLTHRQLVELVMGMGFYVMQSRLIETFQLEPEDPRVAVPLELPDNEFVRAWRRGGL